jgi:hypothetical protein
VHWKRAAVEIDAADQVIDLQPQTAGNAGLVQEDNSPPPEAFRGGAAGEPIFPRPAVVTPVKPPMAKQKGRSLLEVSWKPSLDHGLQR